MCSAIQSVRYGPISRYIFNGASPKLYDKNHYEPMLIEEHVRMYMLDMNMYMETVHACRKGISQ